MRTFYSSLESGENSDAFQWLLLKQNDITHTQYSNLNTELITHSRPWLLLGKR